MISTSKNADRLRPMFGVGSVDEIERPLTVVEEGGTGFDVGAIASDDWKKSRRGDLADERAMGLLEAAKASRRGTAVVVGTVAVVFVGLVVAAVVVYLSMPASVPSVVTRPEDVNGEQVFATAIRLLAASALVLLGTFACRSWMRL